MLIADTRHKSVTLEWFWFTNIHTDVRTKRALGSRLFYCMMYSFRTTVLECGLYKCWYSCVLILHESHCLPNQKHDDPSSKFLIPAGLVFCNVMLSQVINFLLQNKKKSPVENHLKWHKGWETGALDFTFTHLGRLVWTSEGCSPAPEGNKTDHWYWVVHMSHQNQHSLGLLCFGSHVDVAEKWLTAYFCWWQSHEV